MGNSGDSPRGWEMTEQATLWVAVMSQSRVGGEPHFGAPGPFPHSSLLLLPLDSFLQVDLKHLERRDRVLH